MLETTRSFLKMLKLPDCEKPTVFIEDICGNDTSLEMNQDVFCNNCPAGTKMSAAGESKGLKIRDDEQFIVLAIDRVAYNARLKCYARSNKLVTTSNPDGLIFIDNKLFRCTGVVVQSGSATSGHYWTVTTAGIFDDEVVTLDQQALPNLLAEGVNINTKKQLGLSYLYFLERVQDGVEEAKRAEVIDLL
jgi:hypothetical protein